MGAELLAVGVLALPARATVVLEALKVAAEVDAALDTTRGALDVLEVRIDLHALGELGRVHVDQGGAHGPHEVGLLREGDATGADRVLALVDVDAGVDDAAEQLVHDVREVAGGHRAVQVAHEDGLLGVELLGRAQRVVVVGEYPRYDLDLLVAHAPRRYLKVVLDAVATVLVVLDTVADQRAHRVLALVHDVGEARTCALLAAVACVSLLLLLLLRGFIH